MNTAKQEVYQDLESSRTAVGCCADGPERPAGMSRYEKENALESILRLLNNPHLQHKRCYLKAKAEAIIHELFGDEFSHLDEQEREAMQSFNDFRQKEG